MSFASSIVSSSHSPLQTLHESKTSDCSSTLSQGSIPPEIKPLILPSLASITANLSSNISTTEQSQFGPHRTCPVGFSSGRRFSPLSNSVDYRDSVSPLDSEHSTSIFGEERPSIGGISMIMTSIHRPRSRSSLSGPSLTGKFAEPDVHADESASDSGSSDKKNEDNDSFTLSKKRSRTLTTPSQQRRLMQILEQTRFPSTEVREQLARELGMTPRRVQIWFQNRRQGMKKALEQKTDNDTSVSSTTNFHRSRGFSFGAYPTPAEMCTHSSLHPFSQANFIPPALPAHQTSPASLSNPLSDSVDSQENLYAPRSVSRGVPRNLHLQLSSDHSAASNHDTAGGSVADLIWSDPSTASSIYSTSSAVDKEVNFSPFAKVNQQIYPNPNSQTPPSMSGSRHRSKTNPDLFGIMNDFIGLSGPAQISSEAINQFQQCPDTYHQRMLLNGSNASTSKNDLWQSSYAQPTSNWHEGLAPLKLETNRYVPDQSFYHLYANSDKPSEASTGSYYPAREQGTIMEDTIGFSTLELGREGAYASNAVSASREHNSSDNAQGAALLAQYHLRQRSQSLNFV